MSPDSNNYFVIIIRIFSANGSCFQKIQILLTFFLPAFSLLFIESKILQTIYII